MTNLSKNIGIFGLGKTGISAYEVLKNEANIVVYDDLKENRNNFATKFDKHLIKDLSSIKWQNLDTIILSPGIPFEHEIINLANLYNIPISSDIDILFEKSKKSYFIAVTGTNGKSTTASLIHYILNYNNIDYSLAGNIGLPALEAGFNKKGYVLELSSFQLDLLKAFKANIAIILNISPDHLDRHKNMANYIAAKCRIFDRMDKNGYTIINLDNDYCTQIFLQLQQAHNLKLIPFSTSKILNKGISIINNKIYDNFFDCNIFDLSLNKNLQGRHNLENIVASFSAARIINLEPTKIIKAIEKFQGLPHRMQYIGTLEQISYYNDSKATNANSAYQSINALENIYWLVGGIAKVGGIQELSSLFHKIKKAYIFGQDKVLFANTLKNKVNFVMCDNLEEAFNLSIIDAKKDQSKHKNILLAPASASYDQFKNFEERGKLFIKLCQQKLDQNE